MGRSEYWSLGTQALPTECHSGTRLSAEQPYVEARKDTKDPKKSELIKIFDNSSMKLNNKF